MERCRVGIIGFGRIGHLHAGWIDASKNAAVAAVYDPTPARREMVIAAGYRVVETLAALLADASINAVLVATPTAMHFEHVMLALAAGKHVLVEKPMALDLPQARQMHESAMEHGRVLSVFQCRRWDADFLAVKRAVASGMFGRVINVETRIGQFASCVGPAAKEYRPGWRNERAFGGGGLYDWGSHLVDQLWQLMLPARPVRVFAQLRGNVWTSDCDDFARVLIDFDNGAVGLCEINTTTRRPLPRWHIDGTEGGAQSPFSLDFDISVWADLTFTDAAGVSRSLGSPPKGLSEVEIWNAFASACRSGGEPPVTVQSVLVTTALLDAARESSRTGRVIEFNDTAHL
ncbi:MAG TPA: Gfo/Idh/MocA family oxidoreductase [Tepidisphaeraceae bacterium]|jgi:predicted dehydrogenase